MATTRTSNKWQQNGGDDFLQLVNEGGGVLAGIDVTGTPYGNLAPPGGAFRQTVIVPSSALLAMYVTPVFILAPPAGYNLFPKGVFGQYIPAASNPIAYQFSDSNVALLVGFDTPPGNQVNLFNSDNFQMYAKGFVDQTITNIQPIWIPSEGPGSMNPDGGFLYLTTDVCPLTAGNGSVKIIVDYSLV